MLRIPFIRYLGVEIVIQNIPRFLYLSISLQHWVLKCFCISFSSKSYIGFYVLARAIMSFLLYVVIPVCLFVYAYAMF